MKITELKKIIKSAVKEAIQEEIKEILLEAIKSPTKKPERVSEFNFDDSKSSPIKDIKTSYSEILKETQMGLTSQNINTFQPQQGTDIINGSLPPGDVDLTQIYKLLDG